MPMRRFLLIIPALLALIVIARPSSAAPPAASVEVTVAVPTSMRSAPFDQARKLRVPQGFSIAVFARVPNARFLATAPNGDLLVSQPGAGNVLLLRPDGDDTPQQFTFAEGMSKPHDIVFHNFGGKSYVFIAAEDAIYRFDYTAGANQAGTRTTVVQNLPNGSNGELKGSYGHTLKNIAIGSDNTLYVSIASATNASPSDLAATPKRGAVYTYSAIATGQQGTSGQLFAEGLRNAEGLDMVPGTNELWVVVNNRDNMKCPYELTIPGTSIVCGSGEQRTEYVDNHPPEEFTRVRQGGNYGWPFCNPNPFSAAGLDNMPFDRDYDNNRNGDKLDCGSADRISKGIQAHSAPLGLTFTGDTNAPVAYRDGAIVGYHGSWNRSKKTGFKFAYFPWDAARNAPGAQVDLVTGWLNDATQDAWGRPVDSAVAPDGAIYLSDDAAGAIYKLASNAANPTSTPLVPNQTSVPVASNTPGPSPTPTNTPGPLDRRQYLNIVTR
ncbi:MAG: sugar dehydrogenase [Roseiflexaceae bacterium]|nr:sugar dehydrogenase [Roseiflexaceae bacterium]